MATMVEMMKQSHELMEKLVEAQTKTAAKDVLTDEQAEQETWKVEVARHLGKGFPEKLILPLTATSILDPCVACEPVLLVLLFAHTDLNQWVEDSVLPGPLLRRWLGLVSRDEVWLPRRASSSDSAFLRENLQRTQDALLSLALSFFRNPTSVPASTWFLEQSPRLTAVEELCKELEGRVIRIRSGSTAAAEFYAAHRLMTRKTGAGLQLISSKIRVRGGMNTGDRTKEEMRDDDEFEESFVDGKWPKKKARQERQNRRNKKLDKDGKDRTRDPTPSDPRRCNKCKKEVTVSWESHKAASPGC
jgi:hypothetical protein